MKLLFRFSSVLALIAIISSSCKKNEVTDISLNYSKISMFVGYTDTLKAVVDATVDNSEFPITWTSSNSSIVLIKNGVITAISNGSAIITAKSGDKTTTCNINVNTEVYPSTNEGYLVYWGDYYESKISNNYVMYLFGEKDSMQMEFNTSLNVTDSIPVGTYTLMSDLTTEKLTPFSIVPAFMYKGAFFGSIYFGSDRALSAIYIGTAKVGSTNGLYNIEYNFIDYYGNTITGVYQGTLKYIDKTKSPSLIKNKSINQRLNTNRTKLFIK